MPSILGSSLTAITVDVNGNLIFTDISGSYSLSTLRQKYIQVASESLASGSWILVSGSYQYNYSNVNIYSSSIVDVIPNNEDAVTVVNAGMYAKTTSYTGYATFYSRYVPQANIGVTINIY